MDVYSQREERAHSTGFVGISADTDDVIDNLEVYEALINPRESERAGGQNGGGMMPPMMGMGGAGGGAAGAAQGGLGSAAGGGAAAAAVTMRTAGAGSPGSLPSPVRPWPPQESGHRRAWRGRDGCRRARSCGHRCIVGTGRSRRLRTGARCGRVYGGCPADEVVGGIGTEGSAPRADVVAVPPGNPDVISVDPAQVEKVAREWSDLAARMAEVGNAASDLQASLEDFGLVKQPAGPYGEMTNGIRQLAGGASKEFDEIAAGLTYGAQAYRDQEAAAAQTVRSAQ
ncbi:hypothetical protein G7085_10675 [Tessaracoccus sp. HDW20]|uniref:hypothetical protein n=1 Tax=Tessaracoccus coleopterorum TaxID=2714950 RepID=UPI0018D2ECD4|nr:hypothetical protein [Tessaracoccus coleopterorum]NHB84916.1 hypothetical protein [Tessaracoccus coleopterorum]